MVRQAEAGVFYQEILDCSRKWGERFKFVSPLR